VRFLLGDVVDRHADSIPYAEFESGVAEVGSLLAALPAALDGFSIAFFAKSVGRSFVRDRLVSAGIELSSLRHPESGPFALCRHQTLPAITFLIGLLVSRFCSGYASRADFTWHERGPLVGKR
jgi:hypothetical protein